MTGDTVLKRNLIVSEMAENLIGSEIIKIAADVNEKIRNGERIYNLTIGDFDPSVFPIPEDLQNEIIKAYKNGHTNYPAADGVLELRKSISSFLKSRQKLEYSSDEILVSGGARPLIYATYRTLVHPGDKIVFPVPSWNNNHYCHLTGAKQVIVEAKAENEFMPTTEELRPYLADATMLALCSPLNPTGTVFTKEGLESICDLVLEENNRREPGSKPLYVLYDQIYSVLSFGGVKHYDPVSLRPEMKHYTVYIDGISKAFSATGVRVGWAFGPQSIIKKMKAILSHIGAWAPKAEQVATAAFLAKTEKVDEFLSHFSGEIEARLQKFYEGFISLKKDGFSVNAIPPKAAIYLTAQFDLAGKKTPSGNILKNSKDITSYLLDDAKIAVVPFYAFGSSDESSWYRISVGTCRLEEIDDCISSIRKSLSKLT